MANLSNINNVLRVSTDLRVGINTDAASYALEIGGTNSGIKLKNSDATSGRVYSLLSDTAGNFQIYDDAAASGRLVITNGGAATFVGTLQSGNFAIGVAPSSFGSGVPTITLQGTAANGRGGAIVFKELDGTVTTNIYSTDGADGYGTVINAAQGSFRVSIGALAANKLEINSSGATFAGNVRISKTDATLEINNSTASLTNADLYISVEDTGQADVRQYGAYPLAFWTNNTQRMRINAQGQTWIGGSYTGADIANGNTAYLNSLNAGAFSILHRNSSDAYIHFNSYYTSSNTYVSKYTGIGMLFGMNAAVNNGIFFEKAPSVSATEIQTFSNVMQIGYGSNNNVGIGTSSPGSKLEIAVTQSNTMTPAAAALAIKGSGGDGLVIGQRSSTPYAAWIQAGYLPTMGTSNHYPIALQPHGGNVGIGTVSPAAKLDVKATGASTGLTFQTTDASNNQNFFIQDGGRTGVRFYPFTIGQTSATSAASGARFQVATTSGDFVVLNDGKTGIGTPTPYSRLDVTGVLSIGVASSDPSFTVASTGMSLINGGSLDIVQGFAGTSSAGDTLVFKYEATSWKAWQLEYCISAAYGFAKGGAGGYLNNGTPNAYYYTTTNQGSNLSINSVVATSGGAGNQHIIITITGVFGIHTCVRMKYTQSGGDGAPRADRASLTLNS